MQWLEPRPHRRLPIRLTPLIDVVFILLLFFMLTSRMEPLGLVQLDTVSKESTATTAEERPARLHITGSGELRWNDETVDAESLSTRLSTYGGNEVRLSTAPEVPLSAFTHWLGQIRANDLEPRWQRSSSPEARQ